MRLMAKKEYVMDGRECIIEDLRSVVEKLDKAIFYKKRALAGAKVRQIGKGNDRAKIR